MEQPTHDPILGSIVSLTLFMVSALFGILEHVDIVLSILAKLVAIGAGASSMFVAYRTYKGNDDTNSKGPSDQV